MDRVSALALRRRRKRKRRAGRGGPRCGLGRRKSLGCGFRGRGLERWGGGGRGR